jgi:hypothetical protein
VLEAEEIGVESTYSKCKMLWMSSKGTQELYQNSSKSWTYSGGNNVGADAMNYQLQAKLFISYNVSRI